MLCPLCHIQNRDNAKFCKGCGLSFTSEVEGAGQPQTTSQPEIQENRQSSAEEQTILAPPQTSVTDPDDPSLEPTQILTPQQMLAFHARRWQQDLEREQQTLSDQGVIDITDMPTVLDGSSEEALAASVPEKTAQDEVPTLPSTPPIRSEPLPDATISANTDSTEGASTIDQATVAQTPALEEEAVTSMPKKEDVVGAVIPSTDDQSGQEPTVVTQSFPTLAVGTVIIERYEVTQVNSEENDEHAYLVTDHQGYQRCWNCQSEQNAEGDEFCIDCGAGLLDATYILHEYPDFASKGNEAHVLQGTMVHTFVDQGRTYVVEQCQVEQAVFPDGVHLLASCASDAGTVRRGEPNEDSTLVLLLERVHESIADPAGVFVVADGMGGHANGQGASRMTISLIAERMVRELLMPPLTAEKANEQPSQFDEETFVTLVRDAVEDANTALCQVNQRNKSDMGSTLTGFMVVGAHAYIFNVGDSRTYMLRNQNLHQLTLDHSLVGQLVAGGLIEPDDVYTHPQRSQIYRSIGDKFNVQVDVFKQQIYPGDILLSCSDGLWEMIRDPQIADILHNALDPRTACTQLVEAANTNGGEDNVSAVVVFVR